MLSVIIPVYNEIETIEPLIMRVLACDCEKEIVAVDDGSQDGTRDVLARLQEQYPQVLHCYYHEKNRGKGGAIQTGLAHIRGDVVVIQDADLEYHPEDYPAALRLIENNWADAVYGSRFLGPHRVFLFWHYVANCFLTFIANLLTSGILTDMETGFKMIRTDLLKRLEIQSYTFDFEVEVTIKLFRHGARVYEIPITYTGRDYEEGKKITWRDGFRALWALMKWGLFYSAKKDPKKAGISSLNS